MRRPALLLALALVLMAPALAQAPDARTLALAAGWKALFLCSGQFVAGLDPAMIAATDLSGGYPELQPHLAGLRSETDAKAGLVRVWFSDSLPPRLAQRTARQGCFQMPVGATGPMIAGAPAGPAASSRTPATLPAPALARADARPWPLGEAGATQPLSPSAAARLAAVIDGAFAGAHGAGTRTSAALVVHRGRIVAERYAQGFGPHVPQRTWSVAKSLTSAAIGRAAALGLLDVARPPAYRAGTRGDPRADITLDQLLRMQSGLWTDGPGNRTDALYFGGATVRETALVAPLEVAPGTRFRYANNDSLLAALALVPAPAPAGAPAVAPDFLEAELLWPAGMTRTQVERDWQGVPVLSSQVWMTARDMARLALLHLNDGQVPDGNGGMRRLLPEGWVKAATSPRGPQPENGLGYGRAIWLMGPAQGLPEGSFAFLGNRGQVALVVPAADLVVVRRGFDPAGAAFDAPGMARAVIAAIGGAEPG